jgi:hypothetical protein
VRPGVEARYLDLEAGEPEIHCASLWPDSGTEAGKIGCVAPSTGRKETRLDWVLHRQYSRYLLPQFGWPKGFGQQRHSRDAAAEGADITSYQ